MAEGDVLRINAEGDQEFAQPTLADVLVAGNNVGATQLPALAAPTIGADLGGSLSLEESTFEGGGGWAYLNGGGSAGIGGDAMLLGGSGDVGGDHWGGGAFQAHGASASANGKVRIVSEGGSGAVGEVLVADGAENATWRGIQVAAGVPEGDPTGMPFAFDSTAVTGGFYFWNGSAWVKVADIL